MSCMEHGGFFLFVARLHIYLPRSLIYLGSTLNLVVVQVFQFHDNVLRNSSHCSHIDDRLDSISTVLIKYYRSEQADLK